LRNAALLASQCGFENPLVVETPAVWGLTGAAASELRVALSSRFAPPLGDTRSEAARFAATLVQICVAWAGPGGTTAVPDIALEALARLSARWGGAPAEAVEAAAAKVRSQKGSSLLAPFARASAAGVAHTAPIPPVPAANPPRRPHADPTPKTESPAASLSVPRAVWAKMSPEARECLQKARAAAKEAGL
jgi:hypothetical protein